MRLCRLAVAMWIGLFSVTTICVGCGSVSRGEYRTLQTQNRILSEQNRAQETELANLREHQRKLEDRLIQADRDAAALGSGAAKAIPR